MNLKKDNKHRMKKYITYKWITFILPICIIIACLLLMELGGILVSQKLYKTIRSFDMIGSTSEVLLDEETDYITLTIDDSIKVLQLTDIHIGAGVLSYRMDQKAIAAIYELVERTKPDLVVLTGDMTYSIPFQTGTLNNKRAATVIGSLMEQMGVYWTVVFGNHDYEAFSFYNQEQISQVYNQSSWTKCLYEPGELKVDGFGNDVINIQNQEQIIVHSFYFLDSHAYTEDSILGLDMKYDNIKENQLEWYEKQVGYLDRVNQSRGGDMVPSSMFFHIPIEEYLDAWLMFEKDKEDLSGDIQYHFGRVGEKEPIVDCGINDDAVFETVKRLGHTKAIFVGHDHFNNFSITYEGIRLTYGMSIDYLTYPGISKKTEQRGATLITVLSDGQLDIEQIKLEE